MTELIDQNDVMETFIRSAAASAGGLGPEVSGRAALLARLLGEAGGVESHQFGLDARYAGLGAGDLAGRAPLPDALARTIERQVRLRHRPARRYVTAADGAVETVFVLPRWLYRDPRHADDDLLGHWAPAGSFRVRLRSERDDRERPGIAVDGNPSNLALYRVSPNEVMLRRRAASEKRRRYLVATAQAILDELKAVLGARPSQESDWLRRMIEDPGAAEAEALRVWRGFVSACTVPESFAIPGRALSLADLMVIRSGAEGGRHRETFVIQQPWAAGNLLDRTDAEEQFRTLDENPANALKRAAEFLCCSANAACEKAIGMAKRMPRHRLNVALDRLLGKPGEHGDDHQIRNILLEAHTQDSELLSHVGSDAALARRQIRASIRALYAYRDDTSGSFACAYQLATVLSRIMIRTGCDPDALDPDVLVAGLTALSGDVLAAFVEEQLADPSVPPPVTDADTLDSGVLAFLSLIGGDGPADRLGRPRMTVKQLMKFAAGACERNVHKIAVVKVEVDDKWPPPPGWSADEHGSAGGAEIVPLTTAAAMLIEGKVLQNCLRDGRYERSALLGRLALFSIKARDGRATLALKPKEEMVVGEVQVENWSIDQLRGPLNDDPSPGCLAAASALVQQLNAGRPAVVPRQEVLRRREVQQTLDRARSFNDDTLVALQRWSDLYAGLLPRSLSRTTPADIVARYLQRR